MSARASLFAAVFAALVLGGCGGGGDDGSSSNAPDPFRTVSTVPAPDRADRAAPRYERVTQLRGSGPATRRFTIARGAIQWRASWRCTSGSLTLQAADEQLVKADCPRSGSATTVGSGSQSLRVTADGDWRVRIDQEVDSPLQEKPLDGMSPSKVLARGSFYDIERMGEGSALLYRLPDDRLALRLRGFRTSANTDLFVWVSRATRPKNTAQAFKATHVEIAALKSTLGDQNYVLPRSIDAAEVRSIVIWCEPVRIAYTAASMKPR